ncbi:MAG: T9SS type A sorting domain-containing protein, partial [Bacteroidia bacterium]
FCLSYAGSACKPTSVRNLKGESWIVNQIYPNPTSDRASWSFALPFAGRVVYHIQDVTGKVIEVKDLGVLTAGQNQIDLNTSQLSAGAYFITLQYQGLKTTQKLMIAK